MARPSDRRRGHPARRPARVSTPGAAPIAALLAGSVALGVAIAATRDPAVPEASVTHRPIAVSADGYVSSETCQACHPSQYATWYGSFHRTMTQVATPKTVRADFDGVVVDAVPGRPMRLERRGDEFWAEFDDPGWEGLPSERPRITRQVVLITGSHHQHIYWYATGHDRTLNVLPGAYLLDEARWTPRSAVVLSPPNQGVATLDGHWNAICIACHTTHGKTQFDTPYRSEPITDQAVDTTVAEFGIACEACHGPATAHVAANRNPARRYALHAADAPDPTIVEPTRLDPQRSSQVCGQCHSIWEFRDAADERAANAGGLPYRPGDDLHHTRFVAQPTANRESSMMQALLVSDPDFVRGSFWADGLVRVSGREYNGLIDSPCYANATTPERTLSCYSCHTMHKTPEDPRSVAAWADTHQITAGMDGDAACTQCHESIAADIEAHTFHPAENAGSRCYNCHMPYTSYGLMRAIRSHTVTSPSVRETVDVGRPNACNLCHLDRTLAWTGGRARQLVRAGVAPARRRRAARRGVGPLAAAGRRRPARARCLELRLAAGAGGVRDELDGAVPGRTAGRFVRHGPLHRVPFAPDAARLRIVRVRLHRRPRRPDRGRGPRAYRLAREHPIARASRPGTAFLVRRRTRHRGDAPSVRSTGHPPAVPA